MITLTIDYDSVLWRIVRKHHADWLTPFTWSTHKSTTFTLMIIPGSFNERSQIDNNRKRTTNVTDKSNGSSSVTWRQSRGFLVTRIDALLVKSQFLPKFLRLFITWDEIDKFGSIILTHTVWNWCQRTTKVILHSVILIIFTPLGDKLLLAWFPLIMNFHSPRIKGDFETMVKYTKQNPLVTDSVLLRSCFVFI